LLMEHFDAGTITRLCDCGCNSYSLSVRKDTRLKPLMPKKGRGGCVLAIAFHMNDRAGSVELDIFADSDGYLAGIDIACNSNSEPMPVNPQLSDVPYHVHGLLMR
jgi:hypothetical protein